MRMLQMSYRKSILYHLNILNPELCDESLEEYDC